MRGPASCRRNRLAVVVIAAGVVLGLPAAVAHGGTVYSAYGGAEFTAAPGEKNVLTITLGPNPATALSGLFDVVFTDEGAPITSAPGCRRLTAKSVSCRADTASADLGDQNDKAVLATGEQEVCRDACGVSGSVVRGGPGDDVIVGSPFADSEYGGDGNDTLIGNAGSDELYGELGNDKIDGADGFADWINCGEGTDTVVRDIVLDSPYLYCERGVLGP